MRANTAPTAAASQSLGYWLVASDGGVFSGGDATFHGSTGAIHLARPIVGIAATPSGNGYWSVASDGGIFAFGDAAFHGSTGGIHLNKPIVGIASTPSGKGYWLVASDGGIFAFGDAAFHGSTGAMHLNQPIVAIGTSPSGHGYRLVASDGGVFSFGDAPFYGSTGGIHLNQPIVGMAPTASGHGYWFVAKDGGVFSFGDAGFFGAAGALSASTSIVGMVATAPVPNATQLAFTTEPGSSTGGLPFTAQPAVTLLDSNGVPATHNSSAVKLSITTPAGATLACANDTMNAVAGVASFSGCAIDVAGNYTLTATDGTMTPAVSGHVVVSVGAAAKLRFANQPSGAVLAVAFGTQPVVRVEDAGGNLVTAGSSVVTLSLTPPLVGSPVLACTTALTRTTASGLATFTGCNVSAAGEYTLTATDGLLTPAVSANTEITTAAAKLAFTTEPSSATTGGVNFGVQPVVTVQDATGHTIVANTSLVTLAKSGTGASALVCASNAVNAVAGVATFAGCHYNLAGSYTVTATGPGLTAAISGAVTITTGAVSQLLFTQEPSTTASGGTNFGVQPMVTVEDAGGNPVTAVNTITLSLTGSPVNTALTCAPGSDAQTTSAGVATFAGCSINTSSGTARTLTATGAGHTAVSSGVTVSAGVAAKVVLTQQPSTTATGGTNFAQSPIATVEDAGGNTVIAGNSVTLSVTGNPAGVVLTCAGSDVQSTTNGVATFTGCSINKSNVAAYTLTATATAGGSVASGNVLVSTGPASQLVFTQQPSTTGTGGLNFGQQPIVTVEDAGGNTVTAVNTITLSLTGSPVNTALTCAPGTDAQTTSAGVATFAGCSINTSSGTARTLTATGAGQTGVSSGVTISTGVAAKLGFTTQPGDSTGGVAFAQPVIAVQDAGGNTVTTGTASVVHMALTTANGATLTCAPGTNDQTTVNGVATFAGCKIDLAGSYTLTATDGSLTSATSVAHPIITVGAAVALVYFRQPVGAAATNPFGTMPVVRIVDLGGNTVTTDVSGVLLTVSGSTGVLSCTANPLNAIAGVATFAGCAISLAGTYTLTASDPSESLTTAVSNSVTIS